MPVLLLLVRRLGFDPVTAVAMSLGAAGVGAAFSPINPFQVGIAQQIAELPPLSGGAFTFATMIYGMLALGWGFTEMAALFFLMGVAAGLVAGFGWSGTAEAFVSGFRAMAGAALLVGFARAIYIALDEGQILDTLVHSLFTPLEQLPLGASAVGMMVAHSLIHITVPSVSGQAVLTIPILVPLSDLLQLSRQVTVLAYQYAAGLCDILTPINGALMAILTAAGVPYDRWLRFVLPLWAALFVLGAVAVVVGIATGL